MYQSQIQPRKRDQQVFSNVNGDFRMVSISQNSFCEHAAVWTRTPIKSQILTYNGSYKQRDQVLSVSCLNGVLYFQNPDEEKECYSLDATFSYLSILDEKANKGQALQLKKNDSVFRIISEFAEEMVCLFDNLKRYTIQNGAKKRYDFFSELGEGGQAVIYEAYHKKTNQRFAGKVLKISELHFTQQGVPSCLQELKCHQLLSGCSTVLELEEIFESSDNIIIMIEYCGGGNLGQWIQKNKGTIAEENVQQIMTQIFLALDYMESRRVIHRDLKPENILLVSKDRLEIRIADFGLGLQLPEQKKISSKCGTPGYMAPEILLGRPYGLQADMFSAGVILFNLITYQHLIPTDSNARMLESNMNFTLDWIRPRLSIVGGLAKAMLFLVLNEHPSQRVTAAEALNHQFFKKDQAAISQALTINEKVIKAHRQCNSSLKPSQLTLNRRDTLANMSQMIQKILGKEPEEGSLRPERMVTEKCKRQPKSCIRSRNLHLKNQKFSYYQLISHQEEERFFPGGQIPMLSQGSSLFSQQAPHLNRKKTNFSGIKSYQRKNLMNVFQVKKNDFLEQKQTESEIDDEEFEVNEKEEKMKPYNYYQFTEMILAKNTNLSSINVRAKICKDDSLVQTVHTTE